jgi:hypothetical protein
MYMLRISFWAFGVLQSYTHCCTIYSWDSVKIVILRSGGVAYVVVIASAYRTEDLGFESRQGVCKVYRTVYVHTLQCCSQNLNALSFCLLEKIKCFQICLFVLL